MKCFIAWEAGENSSEESTPKETTNTTNTPARVRNKSKENLETKCGCMWIDHKKQMEEKGRGNTLEGGEGLEDGGGDTEMTKAAGIIGRG